MTSSWDNAAASTTAAPGEEQGYSLPADYDYQCMRARTAGDLDRTSGRPYYASFPDDLYMYAGNAELYQSCYDATYFADARTQPTTATPGDPGATSDTLGSYGFLMRGESGLQQDATADTSVPAGASTWARMGFWSWAAIGAAAGLLGTGAWLYVRSRRTDGRRPNPAPAVPCYLLNEDGECEQG